MKDLIDFMKTEGNAQRKIREQRFRCREGHITSDTIKISLDKNNCRLINNFLIHPTSSPKIARKSISGN